MANPSNNYAQIPIQRDTLDKLRSVINALVCDNRLGNAPDVVEIANILGQGDIKHWDGIVLIFSDPPTQ